MISGLNIMT